MVQGQTKVISAYKATSEAKSASMGAIKKQSPFDFKEQNRNLTSSNARGGNNDSKKADSWGKVFKNEQHFKSLHIC